ncbi:threalose-6-phosphate phosphatase [Saitoella coloradoensis]
MSTPDKFKLHDMQDAHSQSYLDTSEFIEPSMVPEAAKPSGRVIHAVQAIPFECYLDKESNWSLKARRGNSALYSAIRWLGAETNWDTLLVGWTGEIKQPSQTGVPVDDNAEISVSAEQKEGLTQALKKTDKKEQEIVPIWMLKDGEGESVTKQKRYREYAENLLWPLFHYIVWSEVTDGRKEKVWWKEYIKFNQIFADKIVEIYQPGDVIWVHDYHLLLLPQMLRQKLPHAFIGSFLHAPFPSSEYFRCLPQRKELLQGMLGANMLGFQTYSYSRHFISSCTRVLGVESTAHGVDAHGARVAVEVFPIGIETTRVEREMHLPGVQPKMETIRELYAGKKIIVGRDRLDAVRGVTQKLQAFERFLEEYPEWRGKVVLIQVTTPAGYPSTKVERRVSDLVAHINGTYGSLHFTPVHHYHQTLDTEEYFALLRVADLGLITSVRDGMNTTSLEYVVCQKENAGPLIISEFSGTAGSLGDAIHVNPWDFAGTAKAINEGLSMSDADKKARQEALYKKVTAHSMQAWCSTFLKRLFANVTSFDVSSQTPALDRSLVIDTYKKAQRRLLMFDYDGTLTPIVRDPAAAVPTDKMLRSLKLLAADPKNQIWIISGRDQKFLEEWMGDIPGLGLSAEHGSFIRKPRSEEWINLTEKLDMSWQKDVIDIFQYFTERTQGSFIEKKRCAVTWHYRRADPEYGAFQAHECQAHLESVVTSKLPVEVLIGKANLEVRPESINKGEVVRDLVEAYGAEAPDFIFCAGDDKTDEDMFRALRMADTVKSEQSFPTTVGPSSKISLASWHVNEPHDIVQIIGVLSGSVNESAIQQKAAAAPEAE